LLQPTSVTTQPSWRAHLTPGAQIDELRRALIEFEQRRQAAEVKLADCERRLGTARQTIAAQDRRIGWLTSEVARLRDTDASTMPADYARDAAQFFSVYGIGGAR
jgi:chromosome segregation ATPase